MTSRIWTPRHVRADANPHIGDLAWRNRRAAHAGDDEFDQGALDPAWTLQATSGTATPTVGGDVLSVVNANQNSLGTCVLIRPITIAAGGYIETALRCFGTAGNLVVGLCFTDGTGAAANLAACTIDVKGNNLTFRTGVVNNQSANGTNVTGISYSSMVGGWIYLRETWVSANTFRCEISLDGVTYSAFGGADSTKTMTPTQMGLFFSTYGAGTQLNAYEYFRCSG